MVYFYFTPGSPQSPTQMEDLARDEVPYSTRRKKWRWQEQEEREEHSSCVVNRNASSLPAIAVSMVRAAASDTISVTAAWSPSHCSWRDGMSPAAKCYPGTNPDTSLLWFAFALVHCGWEEHARGKSTPLQQVTWQGWAGVNLSSASAGDLASQRGPALAQPSGPHLFTPHHME